MQFFIFCAAEGRVLKSCVSIRVFFVECSVLFFAFSSLFLQCLPKVSVGLGEPARDLQLFKKTFSFFVSPCFFLAWSLRVRKWLKFLSQGDSLSIFVDSRFFFGPDELRGRLCPFHSAQSVAAAACRTSFGERGTQRSSVGPPFSLSVKLHAHKFFRSGCMRFGRPPAQVGENPATQAAASAAARAGQLDQLIWPEAAQFRGGGASSSRASSSSQPFRVCGQQRCRTLPNGQAFGRGQIFP